MEEPTSNGHRDLLGVRIERGAVDAVDWSTLRKRSLDLLRRSKNPVSCLARMRERTVAFLGLDSADLGVDPGLKNGQRAPVGEVTMPGSDPVLQNSENFKSEKGKKEDASEQEDWDHMVVLVNPMFDAGDLSVNLRDVGTNSVDKSENFSSFGREIGSFISSVPVLPLPLGRWRRMHNVQHDDPHYLGWEKGIAADRAFECTVIKFEYQDQQAMIQYVKLPLFCFFCGYLTQSEKSRGRKPKGGVPTCIYDGRLTCSEHGMNKGWNHLNRKVPQVIKQNKDSKSKRQKKEGEDSNSEKSLSADSLEGFRREQ